MILRAFRRRLIAPALWRSLLLLLLLQWNASPRAISLHGLHIRTGLERLGKAADVADDIHVTVERQGYYRLASESVIVRLSGEEDRKCGGLLQQSKR